MRAKHVVGVAAAGVLLLSLVVAVPVFAATPAWKVNSVVSPRNITPGGQGELIVTAMNLGDAVAEGATSPITITDVLPAGFSATEISGDGLNCEMSTLTCVSTSAVAPYERLSVTIHVAAAENAPTNGVNKVSVSGGGALPETGSGPVSVSAAPPRFGVENLELNPLNENGSPDTQAGSHPFELTTTLDLNLKQGPQGALPVGLAKDLSFRLPPGLVGNPEVLPRCTEAQFTRLVLELASQCPDNTAIGVASLSLTEFFEQGGVGKLYAPVFNLVPNVGEPARFGFEILGVFVYLDTAVQAGGDYGVTVNVNNISQIVAFEGSQVTLWGSPADPLHDSARGSCVKLFGPRGTCPVSGQVVVPFLTLPTSCTGPLKTSVLVDSWEEPNNLLEGSYTLRDSAGTELGMDGCNRLPFNPSISVAPDGQAASTPTGLTVGIHVPQEATLTPTGLSEADVKDTTVTLPEGVALNPAAADGLGACSTEQIGFKGVAPLSGTNLFSPGTAACPEDSKVGTVQIQTPLLADPLEGAVYLAAQNQNPFGSLVALYIVAEDPKAGVLIKLAGEVKLSESGRIVSTFDNTPQLPFENLHLKFFGTARAPLSTPALCGGYTTTASIAPWSGNPPADSSSEFKITTGPNGSPCADPLPFAPSLTAGTTSIQAGGFSPFTMTMSREDGDQDLQGIQLHMPPGLSGLLAGVTLCGEAQANAGTCGPDSQIGETIVSVGLGGDPFSVKGGKVFITGPYEGAPFGLSIVNPAKAGPFDLGQVVVRARIEVDPVTSALTITTDNTGPYRIPTMLDGIPLQIKHVNVTVNRSGFTFNPTNCDPQAITGSLQSTQGASQDLSVPFQVTNCATLGFKPSFKVSTSGKTSRANGASLKVKLAYPKTTFGSQANIKTVKVDLPKQLPSRLSTLQKACPDKTFNENPALCSTASRIGQAKATTPLIPVPLTGPVYFVSHGGAKFPELIIVLQGYGVTVDLHSETFISKQGITSSTFHTVPDVPVGTFELELPQGPFSALAANGGLCKSKLRMPTAFTAQNGAVIHQNTPIGVTGCPKHKAKNARKASHRRHQHQTKGKHGKKR
jgi:hypothetical protein